MFRGKNMGSNTAEKQKQFKSAMELYESKNIYKLFGKGISIVNISLQLILAYMILPINIGLWRQIFSFVLAFIFTDFINGLVHMYMDNNDNYDSVTGPLIASFHLHHKTPLYKKNHIFIVYFNESGSKIWLAGFLIIAVLMVGMLRINPVVSYILLYFSILSSVAEVSHYLCHVSNSRVVDIFRKIRILLNKRHHGRHHVEDNVNYAFLNGLSDPIINIIAKKLYPGYKNTTDLHYAYYDGRGTTNR